MNTKLLLLFGLSFLFFECDEQEDAEFSICDDNPIENVAWIKELVEGEDLIDSTNGLEIIQYGYQGNTVFSVDRCIDCSDSLIEIYDCDENIICEFGGIAGLNTCPGFENEAEEQGVVFSNKVEEDSIDKIIFQNSFGSCLGHCIQSIEIEDKKLVFISNDRLEELEPIVCEFNLDDDQWESLQNDLDVDQFLELDDVFGCPDCADGGASFIEIGMTNGETKKVIFEYRNPPSIIEAYAEMLQDLLDGANNCEEVPPEEDCYKKVIISEDVYNAYDASEMIGIELNGNCMDITYYVSNGSKTAEIINLIDSGIIAESLPVQRSLKFHYSATVIGIEGLVEATTSFDISELANLDDPEFVLNIEGYDEKITYIRQLLCDEDPLADCEISQESELKNLKQTLEELKLISSVVTCETVEEIMAAPVGDKPCGGPQLYLPYNSSIDVSEFLNKIEIYTKAEEAYNIKWGIASTCDITPMPTYNCEEGKPIESSLNLN